MNISNNYKNFKDKIYNLFFGRLLREIEVKYDKRHKDLNDIYSVLADKIKDIPEGLCWMCSGGLKRWKGCIGWNGRWFCGEECLQRFHQLRLKPNEDYKSLPDEHGVQHRIEVIKPK